MRYDELVKLCVQDIEAISDKRFIVKIDFTKTDEPRQFIVGSLFYETVKAYMSLRPTDFKEDRFLSTTRKESVPTKILAKIK